MIDVRRIFFCNPDFQIEQYQVGRDIVFRSLVTKWKNSRSNSCFTSEREICRGRLANVHIVDAQRSAASDCHVDGDVESTSRIYTIACHSPSRLREKPKIAKIQSPVTAGRARFFTDLAQSLTRSSAATAAPNRSFSRTGNPRSCTPRTLRATLSYPVRS